MQLLARFGFGYAVALLIGALLGTGNLVWCFPVLLLLLVIGLAAQKLRGSKTFWCLITAAVLGFGTFLLYTTLVYAPAERLDQKTVTVKGWVEDTSHQNSMYTYELSVLEIDGEASPSFSVQIKSREDLSLEYGEVFSVQTKLSLNQPAEGTVLRDYYKSHRLFLDGYVMEGTQKFYPERVQNLTTVFRSLRDSLSEALLNHMPRDTAEIATGMLFGGSSSLDDLKRITFSRGGITHLFSVSGLHMTIIIQLAMGFFALLRLNRRLAAILGMAAVFGFMLLAGCTPSVLRAGIMNLILLSGQLFRRPANGLNSLGIACLVICLMNPYTVFDAGFLLSVSATLSILLMATPLTDKICGWLRIHSRAATNIVSLFAVSVAAVLGTIPVNLLYFQEISVIGIALNPAINLFVSIAMFSGFATAFLGLVPFLSPLASLTGAVCSWAVGVIDFGAEAAVKLPFAYLPLGDGYIRVWLVLTVLGFLAYWFFFRRSSKAKFIFISVSVVLLVVPLAAGNYVTNNSLVVTAVRSEDESGVLIQADEVNLLYGAGSYKLGTALRGELMAMGVKDIHLYIQPDEKNASGMVARTFDSLFNVDYLALEDDALMKMNYPPGISESQLIPFGEVEITYSNALKVRLYGEETPVLEVLYRGDCYLFTPDMALALNYLKTDAKLVVAGVSSTDRSDLKAETVVLMSPAEGSFGGDYVSGYKTVRTTLLYPNWGGHYITQG